MQGYERDPRSLAKRAEAYLKSTGIADGALFGPENEFFIFDSVQSGIEHATAASTRSTPCRARGTPATTTPDGNTGHRPGVKGGYFPVPPVDAFQDIRSAMCNALEEMGLKVEVHHHEVATGGQCEIGVGAGGLVKKADEVQILKYACTTWRTATARPRRSCPSRSSATTAAACTCTSRCRRTARRCSPATSTAACPRLALYYIGGIIKHAKALNAFTNPGTNSYKRLVPGFEAPVMLAYSARNRSASIRIPWVSNPKARRIEVRFPDSTANPYFAFAAMMMAGLDGIQNKIHPGDPADKDLYDLEPEEAKHIPTVCHSLDMALEHLDKDREFLTRGGVFTNDVIDAYIGLKMQEVTRFRMTTHPVEMEMYYSC